ncbi:SDR family NAD(P)-dependent oxidoreductase [Halorubrum halodurans]|uniref:3-oxoacyl-ACP reductase n=1 Tax=Halorubrum halodurans TaxID=1383851 RepID=A0A256IGX5_9EURY|nr:SDR family oxidoreductase [Halorubrum halodurans]OYR55795.1 3-oxoacyl-ACP reductase [Halorubrum halodurans]
MQSVIVTGDSRGLGTATVQALLAETEYQIIGISRSESENTEEFEEEYPDRYCHINFDLSNPEKISDLYQEELKPRGPIYGLVNNAAMAYDDLVTNASVSPLEQMFRINVLSSIFLSKFSLRDMMLNRTEGALVHVSSVSTATGYKGLSMYAATKGALEAFSLNTAREWGGRGIRSNCVVPGFMNTSMTDSLDEDVKDRIYNRTGLGEPTQQASVAETIVFLLSGGASSITGETIRVDSGTL